MPELPEVETIKNELLEKILNKKIIDLKILDNKIIKNISPQKLKKEIVDKKIIALKRRGKHLLLKLENNYYLNIHLIMTGQLIWQAPIKKELVAGGHFQKNGHCNLPNKYTRLYFVFKNNEFLYFNDARRFAWLKYSSQKELDILDSRLGPEPLSETFNFELFLEKLKNSHQQRVKPFLLDQKKIAGIGNIYADEICYLAKILPQRKIGSLKSSEQRKLFNSISKILKTAIQKNGTTFQDYLTTSGKKGNYLPYLKVYGRKNKPCPKCHQLIKKEYLAGRGTHFCPNCQN